MINLKQYILALASLGLVSSLLTFSGNVEARQFTNKYDRDFKEAVEIHLPTWDYKWLKAQCYQESLLKPDAVSYVGASGLCQFMPATWKDVSKNLGWVLVDVFDPSYNIQAAAYYDRKLWNSWKSKRTEQSRRDLTFASYNAGLKSLLDAQKLCGMKAEYSEIVPCLEQVTGKHHKETLTYVERINKWYLMMLLE